MRIGVPKEIKEMENRVGATPAGVAELVRNGHQVFVENDSGLGSGFINSEYQEAGANMVDTAAEVWSTEMVYKVKEPLPEEYGFFLEDLLLFTYLHLAADKKLTEDLANLLNTF